MHRLKALLVMALLGLCAAAQAQRPPLETVPNVDPQRMAGRWYEIAYTPNIIENQCAANTTDEYQLLPSGEIQVFFRCQKADGSQHVAEGRSKPNAQGDYGRQKTTFLNLWGWRYALGGDYWITHLDPAYQVLLIGQPSRRYAWIMARTPSLPLETLALLVAKLDAQGYDPCRLMMTVQAGGERQRRPLCQAALTAIPPEAGEDK